MFRRTLFTVEYYDQYGKEALEETDPGKAEL
jgi:hypothetical protein